MDLVLFVLFRKFVVLKLLKVYVLPLNGVGVSLSIERWKFGPCLDLFTFVISSIVKMYSWCHLSDKHLTPFAFDERGKRRYRLKLS